MLTVYIPAFTPYNIYHTSKYMYLVCGGRAVYIIYMYMYILYIYMYFYIHVHLVYTCISTYMYILYVLCISTYMYRREMCVHTCVSTCILFVEGDVCMFVCGGRDMYIHVYVIF